MWDIYSVRAWLTRHILRIKCYKPTFYSPVYGLLLLLILHVRNRRFKELPYFSSTMFKFHHRWRKIIQQGISEIQNGGRSLSWTSMLSISGLKKLVFPWYYNILVWQIIPWSKSRICRFSTLNFWCKRLQ